MNGQRSFKMTVAYDGTRFAGWQVQPGRETIQGMIEKAIAQVCRQRVRVTGSGRTDAGVHALGQVASFSLIGWRAAADDLARALNSKLPPEISVLRVADAPPDFHAIRDAVGKRYRYQLRIGGVRDPLDYRFRWYLPAGLDVTAIEQAGGYLCGRHDFASFQAAGSDRTTTVRHVRDLSVRWRWVLQPEPKMPTAAPGCDRQPADCGQGRAGQGSWPQPVCLLDLEIEADGFLYNMVRNIVGTLVEVGRGKRPAGWMQEVLQAKDRCVAGPTAPAHGLVLVRVDYRPTDGAC